MNRREAELRIKSVLTKWSDDTHNVFTPFELCDEMLDKLPELNRNQKIMVMFNLEFLYVLKERINNLENVSFLTPCENKAKVAEAMGVKKNNVYFYSYNKKEIKNIENMSKFDCVIQNPPYKKSLHLKFLELGFDVIKDDGKMVIVNPSSWLILLREGKTKQKYDAIKNKIHKYVKHVEFFSAQKWFNNISLYMPLSILTIDKEYIADEIIFNDRGNIRSIKHLNDANIIGNYLVIKSIENKIKIKNDKYLSNFVNNEEKNFFVNISTLVGNGSLTIQFYDGISRTYKNMFNLVNNTSNNISTSRIYAKSQSKEKLLGNLKTYVSFDNLNEAQNFLNFITKSKLCKYIICTYNIDQHIDSTYFLIPWLDWSMPMNDIDIYKYFNFTEEEISLIEKIIEMYKIK